MKQKIICIPFILILSANMTYCQKYFDFYYTNTSDEQIKKYQLSYNRAEHCLYGGRNKFANNWDCNELSSGGKLADEVIDSLHNEYRKALPASVYVGYVPFKYYQATDQTPEHYVIKTLYSIENEKVSILYQVKICFANNEHNGTFDVESIQIYTSKNARKFDTNLVLSMYKMQIQEDEKEGPGPPVLK